MIYHIVLYICPKFYWLDQLFVCVFKIEITNIFQMLYLAQIFLKMISRLTNTYVEQW